MSPDSLETPCRLERFGEADVSGDKRRRSFRRRSRWHRREVQQPGSWKRLIQENGNSSNSANPC
jgi:hypothetical protein